MTPIVYHGNGLGYTNEKPYLDLKDYILSTDYKYTQPEKLLCLTWSNYTKKTDLELTYEHRGYKNLIRLGIDGGLGEWYQHNKIFSADDPSKWVNINKYFLLKDFLLNTDISQFDYVMCMDAGDVLIDGDLNIFIEEFEKFNCDLLFNSETNMFHDRRTQFFQEEVNRKVDNQQTYKYLNSGCYIIRTSYIRQFVDFIIEDFKHMLTTSDQCICHNFYNREYPRVKIDIFDTITQCLFDNTYINNPDLWEFLQNKYSKVI